MSDQHDLHSCIYSRVSLPQMLAITRLTEEELLPTADVNWTYLNRNKTLEMETEETYLLKP